MLYKAKKGFKDLDNKFFGIHKVNSLIKGASIEITDISTIPKDVADCLEEIKPKKTKKAKKAKGDK